MATATFPKSGAVGLQRNRMLDNYFFSSMALLLLVTVFVGFARSYFLAGIFRAPLPSLVLHIHGAVFSAWILLLITQTTLVSAHRVDIHRRLGMFGFGLAILMVVLGELAGRDMLLRGFAPPRSGLDPRTFYAMPALGILIFGTLIYFAYRQRSNPSAHKRLILIATIAMMDAPTARVPFAPITHHPHTQSIFVYGFLLLLVGYDLWSLHKVHRATRWASLFVFIAQELRIPIGKTGLWLAFAGWVQHLAKLH